MASFAAENCHLLIMQPISFGARLVLQANLSKQIIFLSAYCNIHLLICCIVID